jgi:hypothetical protein
MFFKDTGKAQAHLATLATPTCPALAHFILVLSYTQYTLGPAAEMIMCPGA